MQAHRVNTGSGNVLLTNNIVYDNSANQGGGIGVNTTSGVVTILNNTVSATRQPKPAAASAWASEATPHLPTSPTTSSGLTRPRLVEIF